MGGHESIGAKKRSDGVRWRERMEGGGGGRGERGGDDLSGSFSSFTSSVLKR